MRVPEPLSSAFGAPFEELISRFALERGLLPEPGALASTRFLSRSIVPHVVKLSSVFNRIDEDDEPVAEEDRKAPPRRKSADAASGLAPYWKQSSNPTNFRLAYFLYFMPCNLYRVASVWAELARLGFRWSAGPQLRAIEVGAGPASGAAGIAAGEKYAPVGAPTRGDWALIEQDKGMLELGAEWVAEYFPFLGVGDWGTRKFQRRVALDQPLLPRSAPRFNLWVMSYFLNESELPASVVARNLMDAWDRHLEDEGVAILVEPALRAQSRRLLELRRELLAEARRRGADWFKLLLPCLGEQACGALASEDDWCHEEVVWWRPGYFRTIDRLAGLDRKTLPFSYLVIAKSKRSREELLPALAGGPADQRFRLVSPAHAEGRDLEFFVCGQQGKRRARLRPPEKPARDESYLERGDVLLDAEVRGDANASRVERARKL